MRISLLTRTAIAAALMLFMGNAATAQVVVTESASPNVDLPDDGYIGILDGNDGTGTDAGMACTVLDFSGSGIVDITDMSMDIGITHTWIGDLTVKIKSPTGSILAPLARPAGDSPNVENDTGEGCCGDSSNLDGAAIINFDDGNAVDSEAMGLGLGTNDIVCTADGICDFQPNPDAVATSIANFAAFNGESAVGDWEICVGDAAGGDTGTFNSVALTIEGNIPVELTSFTATANGQGVNLAWATASETNNAGFEIQLKSGETWNPVAFVDGHGTTTEAQTYSHTASDLGVGTHVFRLKQIDFDGAFEYSHEVEATIGVVGTHALSAAYPNPFNPQATFDLSVAQDQHVTAALYNALGQRVAVLFDGTLEANQTSTLQIDGSGLASGLYVVRVQGERFADALRVTLLK